MYNYTPNKMLAMIITVFLTLLVGYGAHGQPSADAGPALNESSLELTEKLPPMTAPPTYSGEFRSLDRALQERIDIPHSVPLDALLPNVRVRFTISPEGEVRDPRIIEGPDFGLHSAVKQAVTELQFDPASRLGTPVPVKAELPINFDV